MHQCIETVSQAMIYKVNFIENWFPLLLRRRAIAITREMERELNRVSLYFRMVSHLIYMYDTSGFNSLPLFAYECAHHDPIKLPHRIHHDL